MAREVFDGIFEWILGFLLKFCTFFIVENFMFLSLLKLLEGILGGGFLVSGAAERGSQPALNIHLPTKYTI